MLLLDTCADFKYQKKLISARLRSTGVVSCSFLAHSLFSWPVWLRRTNEGKEKWGFLALF
jgi:hypothetical protein